MKLSLINQRRIANFKNNRRGYFSFLAIAALFFVSLFAEFIFNDKPLIVSYQDSYYFPIFFSYSEKTFGGDFES